VLFFLIGSFFGVIGLAWSHVLISFSGFAISTYYTKQHLRYGFTAQVRDFIATVYVSLAVAVMMIFIKIQLPAQHIASLITSLTVMPVIFLGLSWVFQPKVLREITGLSFRVLGWRGSPI
jgi:hypothetical protein